MNALRSPLKMIGGKHASADRIVAAFPHPSKYNLFADVCGGAAHVTIAKPPYHHEEVYNDLSDNLVTFWQQIQINAEEMQQRLDGMLYSRKIYYEFYRSLFDKTELEPLERAIRYFYVLRSTGTGWVRRSPVGWNYRTQSVKSFHSAIDLFHVVQERFRDIAIDNRDVLATVKRYDSPQALLYVDTPYFGAEQYYDVSKNGFPHEELADLLSQAKAYVAFSCYPNPVIDQLYPVEKWHRLTWQQSKSSDIQSETPAIATEMLLTNYEPHCQQYGLWQSEEEASNA